jgi:hypothetical protein
MIKTAELIEMFSDNKINNFQAQNEINSDQKSSNSSNFKEPFSRVYEFKKDKIFEYRNTIQPLELSNHDLSASRLKMVDDLSFPQIIPSKLYNIQRPTTISPQWKNRFQSEMSDDPRYGLNY